MSKGQSARVSFKGVKKEDLMSLRPILRSATFFQLLSGSCDILEWRYMYGGDQSQWSILFVSCAF